MAAGLLQPGSRLLASGTVTATGQTASFVLPFADAYRFILIAGTVSGTTPTFDGVFQDSPDGGTTWVNLPIRFTQLTASNTSAWALVKPFGLADAASAGQTASTGGAAATNTPIIVQNVRFQYTIGGTTPSFAYRLFVNMISRGETSSAS